MCAEHYVAIPCWNKEINMTRNIAKHLFLIILFSLLVSFPPKAADWVNIYSGKELTVLIDKQSIKGEANSREFWATTVFDKAEIDPVSGKYFITTTEYLELDCNSIILKLHEIYYYSDNGAVVNHLSFPQPPITRIAPDSLGESAKKVVCGFKPTK